MCKANMDIRKNALENNIPLCRIADEIGISETYFYRKLRKELPEDEKKRILSVIESLKG